MILNGPSHRVSLQRYVASRTQSLAFGLCRFGFVVLCMFFLDIFITLSLTKIDVQCLISSTLFVLMIFLLISVSGECLQCYWCGPRAEQVHRKERAPSCNEAAVTNQETACDPGYTHCAIVVTAPRMYEGK